MPSAQENYSAQAITNVAQKYLKGAVNNTLRERFFLSYLMEKGRVKTGEAGRDKNWVIRVRRPDIYTQVGGRPQFVANDTNVSLSIGHARREGVDKLPREDMMVNQGETQIFDLAESKMDGLVQAISEQMSADLYLDASSDDTQPAGLETIFQGSVTSGNDLVAVPSSGATYGGQSMELGAEGGNWSSDLASADRWNSGISVDWPQGSGDPEYDYLAPKMFNYTGAWNSGTNNWAVNSEKLMRRAQTSIKALGGAGSAAACHLMDRELYNEFLDNLTDRERLRISDYAQSLGFPDVMSFEGAMVAYDYDCPVGVGYAVNPNQMELCSVHEQLFYVDGPTWDTREQAWLMLVGFLGNFRYNPKYFAKYASYTA